MGDGNGVGGVGVVVVPPATMEAFEYETHRWVVERLRRTAPNLLLLGMGPCASTNNNNNHNGTAPHLPIFSFPVFPSDFFHELGMNFAIKFHSFPPWGGGQNIPHLQGRCF